MAVEPGTGAVKAYYGGDNGNGNDFAGYYNDPVLSNGEDSCCGGHPPGSTIKVYTLATGLMAGYRSTPTGTATLRRVPGQWSYREEPGQERGRGQRSSPNCKSGDGKWCTLEEVTVMSLNVPFFALAEKSVRRR